MRMPTKLKIYLIVAFMVSVAGCNFLQPDYVNVITATELNQLMQKEDILLIDVHTPEQRHIKGTDLFIPYNEIEKYQDKLPKAKNTAIYVYCEGGPMGNAAARTLYELGYHNLTNLKGGEKAWRENGLPLE